MGNIDKEIWYNDWELTGSPLYRGRMKSEPLWSYHASIETIKKSPGKLLQEQSIDTSCFLSLETTIRGSLFHSNAKKEPFQEVDADGNDHSLAAHGLTLASNTSALALSSSSPKPLHVSPPRPSSGRQRNGSLPDLRISVGKSSPDDGSSSGVMEETKEDCADDDQLSVNNSNSEKPISRYEQLQKERLKLRAKIAQRKMERQNLLPVDSNHRRRTKAEDTQNDSLSSAVSKKTWRGPSRSGNSNQESRLQAAAILIQTCVRRFFAHKILAGKKGEAQQADTKRLQQKQQQQSCSNIAHDRTARVNSILDQIKVRELYHKHFQHGQLYTIQEE